MKKLYPIAIILGAIFYTISFQSEGVQSSNQETKDSLALDRAKYVNAIKETIKGKEELPAESVFSNIKILKGVPAGRILAIMNFGYSRSLGVSCGHCHDTNDFASEEKLTKQIARDMHEFAARVREDLNSIESLADRKPVTINCTTCHRGSIKPALNLE